MLGPPGGNRSLMLPPDLTDSEDELDWGTIASKEKRTEEWKRTR
jgi:hypothetical protein